MARKLVVEIVGDTSALDRAFGRTARQSQTFGERVRKGALVAGAALGGALAISAKIGFDELREGQAVSAQTAAALKSTGEAAGVTQEHIEDLATSLSRMSGVDDEVIQSSENILLAFTNVRNEVGKGNDVFDRATKVVLDYAARTGRDASGAARQFGKALQDPVKYAGALARAGIVLTQQQRDQIKAFQESGKPLEAQKVLLQALEERYGGAAKAAGETLQGQLNRANEAFREMSATILTALLPAMLAITSVLRRVASYLEEHKTLAKALGIAFAALAGVLLTVGVATKLYAAGQAIAAAATAAWTAAQWLLNAALTANPIGVVVVALAALVAGIILAWKHSETFRRIVTAAFDAVKAAATAVLNFFRDNWKIIATLISGPFLPIVALATDAFGIRSKLIAAATAILDFFREHWKTIATIISGPFAPLVALATNAFGIRSALINAFGFIVEGVREKVGALVALIASLPGRIASALGNLSHLLYNAGVQIIQGLINGITDKLGELWGLVSGIGGKIAGLKGPIEQDRRLLIPQGRAIIEGLVAGMQDRLPELEKLVSSIAPKIDIPTPAATAVPTGNVRAATSRVSVVGASSAETFSTPTPSLSAATGAGAMAEVHTHVYLDSTQIAEVVRREYLRFELRNGRSAL